MDPLFVSQVFGCILLTLAQFSILLTSASSSSAGHDKKGNEASNSSTSSSFHYTPGVNYFNAFLHWEFEHSAVYLFAGLWVLLTITCKRLSSLTVYIPRPHFMRRRQSGRDMMTNASDFESNYSLNSSLSLHKTQSINDFSSNNQRKSSTVSGGGGGHGGGGGKSSGHGHGGGGGHGHGHHHKHSNAPADYENYFEFTLEEFVPESTSLILVGLLVGLVFSHVAHVPTTLDPNLVLNILLFPIVMNAAWSVDKTVFYQQCGTVLTFAFIGTLYNSIILCAIFYGFSQWEIFSTVRFSLVQAGMYAVIICAVDPVAVLSVFESMSIERPLYVIVFGESLLNDGVAVVFFHSFSGMAEMEYNLLKINQVFDFWPSIGFMALSFIYCLAVSLLLAILGTFIAALWARSLYGSQKMLVFGVLALDYVFFVLAEIIKGSGILSLFFLILFQRQYVQANMNHSSLETISYILEQSAQIGESLIFLLMGLTLFNAEHTISESLDGVFIATVIVGCYISRYLVVYSLGALLNTVRETKLNYRKQLFIQSHGGLRGAISFSLALILNPTFFTQKRYLETATAMMVLFSVLVLGTTVKYLVRCCRTKLEVEREERCFDRLQEQVMERTLEVMKEITGDTTLIMRWQSCYREMNNSILKRCLMHEDAQERTCRSSSLVRQHSRLSIRSAQEMAEKNSESMSIISALNGRETLVSAMSLIKSRSMRSLSVDGSCLDIDHNCSVPDFAQLEASHSRRDVDDRMTHHNLIDYSAKHKRLPKKIDPSKLKMTHQNDKHNNRRSHKAAYFRPPRLLTVSQGDLETNPEIALMKTRRVYGVKKSNRNNGLPQVSSQVKFSSLCGRVVFTLHEAPNEDEIGQRTSDEASPPPEISMGLPPTPPGRGSSNSATNANNTSPPLQTQTSVGHKISTKPGLLNRILGKVPKKSKKWTVDEDVDNGNILLTSVDSLASTRGVGLRVMTEPSLPILEDDMCDVFTGAGCGADGDDECAVDHLPWRHNHSIRRDERRLSLTEEEPPTTSPINDRSQASSFFFSSSADDEFCSCADDSSTAQQHQQQTIANPDPKSDRVYQHHHQQLDSRVGGGGHHHHHGGGGGGTPQGRIQQSKNKLSPTSPAAAANGGGKSDSPSPSSAKVNSSSVSSSSHHSKPRNSKSSSEKAGPKFTIGGEVDDVNVPRVKTISTSSAGAGAAGDRGTTKKQQQRDRVV